ncbi:MAG: IS66 family insertion sequence element accessory protein TnpB [Verrucomicrobia bacterium]|nr:IS66 family insertion sequence element accessory protein TnpB [Verrucomicrobiota bacterium]
MVGRDRALAARIYLAAGATDLRKSFEGLSDLVAHQLGQDPLSGHLFVFANRLGIRIMLLYWDGYRTCPIMVGLVCGCAPNDFPKGRFTGRPLPRTRGVGCRYWPRN